MARGFYHIFIIWFFCTGHYSFYEIFPASMHSSAKINEHLRIFFSFIQIISQIISTTLLEKIAHFSPNVIPNLAERDCRRMLSVTKTGWLPTLRIAGIIPLFSVTDDISCSLFLGRKIKLPETLCTISLSGLRPCLFCLLKRESRILGNLLL